MVARSKVLLRCATILAGVGMTAAGGAFAAPVSETTTRAEPGHPVAFNVVLPLRNRDKLEGFVAALHDPASPSCHHWLAPLSGTPQTPSNP